MTWLWLELLRLPQCATDNKATAKVFIGTGTGGTAITTLHLSSQLAAVRHPTKGGEGQNLMKLIEAQQM